MPSSVLHVILNFVLLCWISLATSQCPASPGNYPVRKEKNWEDAWLIKLLETSCPVSIGILQFDKNDSSIWAVKEFAQKLGVSSS